MSDVFFLKIKVKIEGEDGEDSRKKKVPFSHLHGKNEVWPMGYIIWGAKFHCHQSMTISTQKDWDDA